MKNLAVKHTSSAILKQHIHLNLKGLARLENINIFTIPSRIKTTDINAMFNGLLALLNEKVKQEQSEKYFQLQLKYNRLKYLYNIAKQQLKNQKI